MRSPSNRSPSLCNDDNGVEEDWEDEDDEEAEEEDECDDDALSLAEASDAEDLLSLDEDLPEGLIEYDGSDADSDADVPEEEEEWGGIGGGKKRKRGDDDAKSRKKKLRSLPTFASYEDYAKLIDDEPEDNI